MIIKDRLSDLALRARNRHDAWSGDVSIELRAAIYTALILALILAALALVAAFPEEFLVLAGASMLVGLIALGVMALYGFILERLRRDEH